MRKIDKVIKMAEICVKPLPHLITYFIIATLSYSNSEYIPPGPAYSCPKETDLLYPCVCEKGTDSGLFIRCENQGLAVLSVGIGNIAGLGLPIERLLLKNCHFSHLFGPLFHRSTIRVIRVENTPIRSIEAYAFAGVNRTLQELYFADTKFEELPKEAFRILGNMSTLSIDGHAIIKLDKDSFAGELTGRLERLHIVNGMISDIPVEAFQNLKKLKVLDLHGNQLGTLKRNQFRGLRDTDFLDLSHNNIVKLDGSHIGDLAKLGWCNVSHNLMTEIPRGMFARNPLLKVLHLDHNKLKKLDTNSFKGMRFLRRLYLQDNQISDIGRGTFSSVSRIGTVDLARNFITKVDYQMFQAVKYAELINLGENKIQSVESQAFTDLFQATVNISHNELAKIDSGAFQNCNNMTLLDFSHNNLTEINKKAFDENSYAYKLDVSFNGLTDFSQIPITNMTGIAIINASFNSITTIPKQSFPKLYELHTVDISHNALTDIFNGVFMNLFSLRYLNLSHNSLPSIRPATFGTIPTLLELDVSYNNISSVSRGSVAKLSSCRVINMHNNMLENLFQIPAALSELNLSHNKLKEIKSNTWPQMNALLSLDVSSNMLEQLSSDSLNNLLSLQRLNVAGNGISHPPWEALSKTSSLQYLYLQDNNITEIGKSAFGVLPTLFELDLSRNNLTTVAQRSFSGLQQLLNLSLSDNNLTKIPNEAFKSLVALRRLDLSHNKLEKLDNKTNGLLDDCLSLEMVNLSNNNIGFLTKKMFPSSPWIPYRLQEIDLSYNQIPVLTYDVTHGTKTVKKMNFTGNIINEIRNNVLGNLTSLRVLDLSHNDLKTLTSRGSEINIQMPENLTHLYLQNNELQNIPLKSIIESKIKHLDLRHNELSTFDVGIVRKLAVGMEVYFEDNYLKCDCLVRPLKHYLNHLSPSALDEKYKNITCVEPLHLRNENILTIDEDRLICSGIVDDGNTTVKYEEFDLISEPDVAFRDIQYSQTSIYVHWFVFQTQDVADFVVYIRDDKNSLLYTNETTYNLRSLTIPLDADLQEKIKSGGNFDICCQAKTSSGLPRKWHPSQCQKMAGNFESWPKKLNVDKRRLTKKVRYSWFSNSVLGLVSDSILITLCIFLGACLKLTDRLNVD